MDLVDASGGWPRSQVDKTEAVKWTVWQIRMATIARREIEADQSNSCVVLVELSRESRLNAEDDFDQGVIRTISFF